MFVFPKEKEGERIMSLIEYFNPQSCLSYTLGIMSIIAPIIVDSLEMKSVVFSSFFGLMIIGFGVYNGKEKVKEASPKLNKTPEVKK